MSNNMRTVYFYKLIVERTDFVRTPSGEAVAQITPISSGVVHEMFQELLASMRQIGDGRRARTVSLSNSKAVVEVISENEKRVFARIGRPNAANTVGIRDERTLEINDVPMTAEQNLELFTYCYIDFDTGFVSYIGIQGAPKINALSALFNEFNFGYNVNAFLSVILSGDIIDIIARKDVIGKISFTVAIPDDNILATRLNVNAEEFDALRNVKYRSATYNIAADRNKNIFDRSSSLRGLFDKLAAHFGGDLKKITVNAKNHDERMQPYDLLDYYFTKKVSLGGPLNHNTLTQEDFFHALEQTYTQNRTDLLKYSRPTE